jgi:hypothetical protein
MTPDTRTPTEAKFTNFVVTRWAPVMPQTARDVRTGAVPQGLCVHWVWARAGTPLLLAFGRDGPSSATGDWMHRQGSKSWRFGHGDMGYLHTALFVRDAARLPVAPSADIPPRLGGCA